MIASFRHNFVFIKTRKVGGTSAEIALSLGCGPEDIVTPIAFDDEIVRTRLAGGVVVARNYAVNTDVERAFEAAVHKFAVMDEALRGPDLYRAEVRNIRGWRKNRFRSHMPAAEAARALGATFWSTAFKFTIERHPYEKIVSGAFHRLANRGLPPSELPRMIDRAIESGVKNQELYAIDGQLIVDEIIRHETLESDLTRIAKRIGMNMPLPLPRTKALYRKDRRPAREILSEEQKQRIYKAYRPIFDQLGYEP